MMASTAITQHVPLVKNAKILYEPSIYNGSGAEIRKNLVLLVDDATRNQLSAIEEQQNLGPTLCSVLKPDSIRVKVDMEQVRIFDVDHNQITPLEKRVHANTEVRLEVRGIWRTATSGGISVCCTDLRFCSDNTVSPFK